MSDQAPDPYRTPDPYRSPDQGSWSPPPVPYGAVAPGGYGMAPVDHPSGTTVLVLGILGLVVCPITSIFAIVMGNRALREIDANPLAYGNRQSVVIGRILGIVAAAIYGVVIVGYLVFAVAIAGAIGFSSR